MSEPAEYLLGALTLTALRHFGEDTLVIDEGDSLCPGWRMARLDGVALLEKPADNRAPKRIDCYQVAEHNGGGGAFKLDPARLMYSLRWKHNAQPPDFELMLLQDRPQDWVNTANLVLLAELRRRAPRAIDWAPLFATGVVDALDAFEAARDG